ncbi:TrkH family potassium uptake protein [Anaerotignum sp.]|uniref:TrkH family potassium uptake protein n=1 Tax=Anaerotignum sp. TaxID=2039241 RepID=UPI0028A70D61|nr:TrkH family potassium uptake protein [Anaerotignum sp.]
MINEKTKRLRFSNMQIVAMGYFLVATVGTVLLLLPISSVEGNTSLLQAMFTAVSASCVTGLVVVDTSTHWTLFGQVVILILIQIGGMGFMTIGIRFMLLMRHKISLREREVMVESINASQLGGILCLTRRIVAGTFLVESIGAMLLAIRFIPEFGFGKGLFYSVFHSISAFCNAGFDLMGIKEPYNSLVSYSNDTLVNLTIISLIIIGGIGFLVWDDIYYHRLKWKRYHLHTKIVLACTAVLVFGGTMLFYILECRATGAEMGIKEGVLTALFQSVTCRTAGFNTVDTASLSEGSKILSMLLMFIGGSPGSTAGGIKTTTVVVLVLYMISGARRVGQATIFGRTLEVDALQKAVSIFIINLGFALIGALTICAIQPLAATDVLFEVFSAMGTVGMSTGITRELTTASACVITLLMFLGRVGSVSLATALLEKKAKPPITLPTEKIMIG